MKETPLTAQEWVQRLKSESDLSKSTRDDVSYVLGSIAEAGRDRELKTEVIDLIFTRVSPQGFKTSQDLESYPEF